MCSSNEISLPSMWTLDPPPFGKVPRGETAPFEGVRVVQNTRVRRAGPAGRGRQILAASGANGAARRGVSDPESRRLPMPTFDA
jgi:hypothetical protein